MESKKDTPGNTKVDLKTETEHLLYKYYCEEKNERLKLQKNINDLKSQIENLQQQLKLQAGNAAKSATTATETTSPPIEYTTDEEELARETGWIRQKSRKKRKLNTSPAQPTQLTQNEHGRDVNRGNEKVPKTSLPPPIVVDGIQNYQKFFDFLCESQSADTFTIKMMNGDTVKVNAKNEESYRAISKALSDNNCLWHSYENKQERPIRVMAKKLHFTCIPERVVEDLRCKGYKILEAVNKLSWKTKEPLNMFMLSFSNDEETNKIFNIKHILGCNVEIQPVKSTKLVPQCKRCQAYGHTQKYCSKEPRCVKCTGKHLTKDCRKPQEEKPKCVHCGAPHPANYRGCIVAKEIQQIRLKKTKGGNLNPQQSAPARRDDASKSKPSRNVMQTTTKNVSYAQATSSGIAKAPLTDMNSNKKLDEILKLMSSFDERLKKIENSNINATSKTQK